MSRYSSTTWPKENCVIEEEHGGAKYCKSPDGYLAILVNGSINGTKAAVGAKGRLIWSNSPSFGLPFFEEY